MQAVRLPLVTAAVTAAALTAVTGCTEKSDAKDGAGVIEVTATDDSCEVSKKEFPAGHVEIAVENKGSKVTEVYLLFPDDRVVTERENIGPGTRQRVTAEVKAGDYRIACKPGMRGQGIRQDVKATGGGKAVERDPRLDRAVAAYRAYAQEQADETLPKAEAFAKAVKDGDLEAAKKAYAPSRVGWERTEPVAESFGDIDPKVDVREDGLEEGQDPATDRVAPPGEGPVAGREDRRPGEGTGRPADQGPPGLAEPGRQGGHHAHVHGQRRQGTPRRGRHRQGHR